MPRSDETPYKTRETIASVPGNSSEGEFRYQPLLTFPQEKDEYVQNIIEDIATLGLQFDKITYTSDYFPQVISQAAPCG